MKSQKVLLFLTAVIAGSIFSAINCSANDELPLMMIRLRAPHTADHVQWSKTFKVLRENRAACDEARFSTDIGFPKMERHKAHVERLAEYAAQIRSAGIIPSLLFQAVPGHADDMA